MAGGSGKVGSSFHSAPPIRRWAMPNRSSLAAGLLFTLLLIPCAISATEAVATPESWLEEVAPLIGTGEREAFLRITDEGQRQEFVRKFWAARDPYPQTARNELQEGWTERLAEARRRWGSVEDDRARSLLLRGEPDSTFKASCPDAPLYEVWIYEASFRVKHRVSLIFTLDSGVARLWRPG